VNSNTSFFGGHFGAPSSPSSSAPFGDDLLGALAPAGGDNGLPEITFTFAQTLNYISFQVSSATQSNFTAQLIAFNAQHQQIGTYQVVDTGGGGSCAGLTSNPPQPCNDAALLQFYDPTISIASVEVLMMSDDSGLYIDTLGVNETPEPVSSGLAGAGLLLVLYAARRNRLKSAGNTEVSSRN
jgi:hypothetical protein